MISRRTVLLGSISAIFLNSISVSARPVQKLFGYSEIKNTNISPFKKWVGVLNKYKNEIKNPTKKEIEWIKFVKSLSTKSIFYQLEKINTYVNQSMYITDETNYGKKDYWATPREFFDNSGDCEDYAITKYLSLKMLGIPINKLRIVVIQDTLNNISHAVLAYYSKDGIFILDNRNNQIYVDNRISYYKPLYSINEHNWWVHIN